MAQINKTVRVSIDPTFYVFIGFDDKRLSITGVERPLANGDALGSSGQCVDVFDGVKKYASGMDADKAAKLRSIWERWHLNDMRAGCEHQRAENWGRDRIEVVTYGQTTEAFKLRTAAEAKAIAAARDGKVAELSPTERALISPDWFKDKFTPPDADSPLSGMYEVKKREIRWAGQVYPHEHPQGVLTKPCPTCGYKYGSAWLFEPVPADVLEWLATLPHTDAPGAWRN